MAKKIDYAALFTLRPDGRYQGYWRDSRGRHTMCDKDPQRLYERIEAKNRSADEPRVITFRTAAESWEREHREEIGARTWNNYRPHLQEILEKYGSLSVGSLTALQIRQDILQAKSRGYSRTVVQTRRSIFRMICDHAIIKGWRLDNPCTAVRLPKGLPAGKRRAPTDDEIRRIFAAVGQPFGLFAVLLLCTGLRKSEALALTWEDVDLKGRKISVTKTLEYPNGDRPKVKEPKTEAGVRAVPILPQLFPHLEAAKAERSSPLLFPAPPSPRGGAGGGYMSLRAYEGAWKRWQESTGLELTAHNLRHGTATLMFEAGVDELTAQRILGHSRVEITREIYTELRAAQEARSIDKLGEKIADVIANAGSR